MFYMLPSESNWDDSHRWFDICWGPTGCVSPFPDRWGLPGGSSFHYCCWSRSPSHRRLSRRLCWASLEPRRMAFLTFSGSFLEFFDHNWNMLCPDSPPSRRSCVSNRPALSCSHSLPRRPDHCWWFYLVSTEYIKIFHTCNSWECRFLHLYLLFLKASSSMETRCSE